jgi:two-component system, NarL family, nitrate/nitrite response regulator NarL
MFLIATRNNDCAKRWRLVLNSEQVRVVAELPSLRETLLQSAPALLLLDYETLGLDAAGEVGELMKLRRTMKILVMGAFDAQVELALLKAGARGICLPDVALSVLEKAVAVVSHGELWIRRTLIPSLLDELAAASRSLAQSEPEQNVLHSLTAREREIALLIGAGSNNKQIARRLEITERTVKAHVSVIFRKLRVGDRLRVGLLVNRGGMQRHAL